MLLGPNTTTLPAARSTATSAATDAHAKRSGWTCLCFSCIIYVVLLVYPLLRHPKHAPLIYFSTHLLQAVRSSQHSGGCQQLPPPSASFHSVQGLGVCGGGGGGGGSRSGERRDGARSGQPAAGGGVGGVAGGLTAPSLQHQVPFRADNALAGRVCSTVLQAVLGRRREDETQIEDTEEADSCF